MADTERSIPETGPLSIDDHVAMMASGKAGAPLKDEVEQEQPAAVEDTTSPEDAGEVEASGDEEDSEAAPQAAEDGEEAPETDTLEADEEAQETDPAKPTLEPPARWEAEDKALFATLPKKAQETILKREKLQQAEVTKAQQKSSETVKAYETRISHLNDLATQIGEHYVEPGIARMKQWDEWFSSEEAAALAEEDPGAFLKEQTRYRQEQGELRKAMSAKAKAEAEAFQSFAAEQSRLMAEMIPEFADPETGPVQKQALATYLRERGFEPERIRGISALEAAISLKAKKYDDIISKYADKGGIEALVKDAERYRKSEAIAKAPPPPKPKVKAGPNAPASSQGHRPSSDEAAYKSLMSKQSWTAEEHTRVMQLKAKLRK